MISFFIFFVKFFNFISIVQLIKNGAKPRSFYNLSKKRKKFEKNLRLWPISILQQNILKFYNYGTPYYDSTLDFKMTTVILTIIFTYTNVPL